MARSQLSAGLKTRDITYDVKVWGITKEETKRGNSYRLRWRVAGQNRTKNFGTRAQATSQRAELIAATRQGVPFDITTGMPVTMLGLDPSPTWYEHACAYVDMKWNSLAPKSRRSVADALATVTPALLSTSRGRPAPAELRAALYQWAFNAAARRAGGPPEHLAGAVAWLERSTLSLAMIDDPAKLRAALDVLASRMDGTVAAATTIARKRAVFFNAMEYAVERESLSHNPLSRVRWKAPRSAEAVDRRAVVNHDQALVLLNAVAEQGTGATQLVAFCGCMYYAALRPAEVMDLRRSCLILPSDDSSWGELRFATSNPSTGKAWTDSGQRERRQLKHRAREEGRTVPCSPQLAQLLREHLSKFGTAPDGRLFRGRGGGPVPDQAYGRIWRKAREIALTADECASPLAARPYDLRHAAVSTWLNAGVAPAQVADWAGHSVHVLLKVYAKCIVGQEDAARKRIAEALVPGR
jgi:integrase